MAYYPAEILEEGLKIAVHQDWFPKFEYKILGRVDFCICRGEKNFLWAEAKKGVRHEIEESFVQLIFTIKKDNTYGNYLPPKYLGAFDAEKIAFLEYGRVKDFFTMNDFDWTVTPSDHSTREFKLLYDRIVDVLKSERLQFEYDKDEKELREFIKHIDDAQGYEIEVDENNIMFVFNNWCDVVKPAIDVPWDSFKKGGLFDTEFFLADLLSYNNTTLEIYDNLKIILEQTCYKYKEKRELYGKITDFETKLDFKKDGKIAHDQFWNKYHRPPKEDFQKYILNRRDLLVPFDIRERQGAFYTPKKWVELSQKYLADVLGHDWQDNYYIWDCCAGTGNMLFGLRNPERIFASTLEEEDVNVMHQNIKSGIAKLLQGNVFKFDFLNDSFDKLPDKLQNIIKNEPEKLVVYINPPYAEAGNKKTINKTGEHKSGVSKNHVIYEKYKKEINGAANELFALFLYRIYREIPGCIIGNFSTLKVLNGSNFKVFREKFRPTLKSLFLVPADTFDNVKGQFPIGFHIWNTSKKKKFNHIVADVFDKDGFPDGKKTMSCPERKYLNEWLTAFKEQTDDYVGFLTSDAQDFQHNNHVCFRNTKSPGHLGFTKITKNNLIPACIYLSVRHCIEHTWLNHNDQYLFPNKSWRKDETFFYDCLAYALFHHRNRITSTQGTNHFIPFAEIEVKAKNPYKSRFLLDYLAGKIQPQEKNQIFKQEEQKKNEPIIFSAEAQAVMDCAKELYIYYHSQENTENDASFYDIRLYFQGTDAKGRMNSTSNNNMYNELLRNLREAQKILADKIAKKVYEYGFLEE